MTRLVWPNGSSTTEPSSSDGYGPRPIMPGTRPFHVGHDWYGIGSLKAIGSGTVVSTDQVDWAGWQVLINLGVIDGVNTWVRYAHLASRSPLTPGATVRIGDAVGTEGKTGNAFGVHLHLEIYRGAVDRGVWADPGATVDPRTFIAARINAAPEPTKESENEMLFLRIADGQGRYGVPNALYYAVYDGYAFTNVSAGDAGAFAHSQLAGRSFANVSYSGWETFKAAARVVVPVAP